MCDVRVMPELGGIPGFTSAVIAGLNHVVKQCRGNGSLCVANMSLRVGSADNQPTNQAVRDAVAAGVVVVASAGNEASDACSVSPAGERSAITVGNTNKTDALSPYSNFGPCVDVYAPGVEIVSAGLTSPTSTTTMSGTSMSAPRKSQSAQG